MFSFAKCHIGLCALIFVIGFFSCVDSNAARGGGGFGNASGNDRPDNYDRGNDYNNRNRDINDNGVSAVIIGDPGDGYLDASNPTSCSSTQQCDSYGNCTQTQVCN